jgi:hypothetical protein
MSCKKCKGSKPKTMKLKGAYKPMGKKSPKKGK